MKKILLLIVSFLFFIPCVFADMGAPGVEKYNATVTNKNGAVVYDGPGEKTDKVLKYGTVVTIEYEEDGYGDASDVGYIKLTDLAPVEKDYKVNSNDWTYKTTGIVLKDVVVRKGPAGAYEKKTSLKAGTKVTVIFNTNEEIPENSWAYVDDGKTVGFVDTIEGTVAFNPTNSKIRVIYDVDLRNPQTDKKTGSIKANTLLTAKVYNLDAWSGSYYIEYDNVKANIYSNDVTIEGIELEFKVDRDINVYESLLDGEKEEKDYKVVGTLKKGETFKSKYYQFFNGINVVYIESSKFRGWIYDTEIENVGNALIYDDSVLYGDEPISTDPSDDEEELEDEPTEEPTEDDVTVPEPYTGKHVKSVPDRIYTYILIGVILCVTAVVSIILVNKKKKGK